MVRHTDMEMTVIKDVFIMLTVTWEEEAQCTHYARPHGEAERWDEQAKKRK